MPNTIPPGPNRMKYADLHIHTNFSDSTFGVREVLEKARSAGLDCIAICDHDTVDALPSAVKLAKVYDIEVIPSLELTCQNVDREIHILGYFVDYRDEWFLKILEDLKKHRRERIYKISEKLDKMGVKVGPEEVFALCKEGCSVGRLHIARVLVDKGIVSSFREAFRKFIGEKAPAYVSRFKFNPAEAIGIIKKVGGLPVLAHPQKSYCDNIIPHLVESGLEGMEVFYSDQLSGVEDFYKGIASKYDLVMTGGSDCHGFAKREVLIGKVKIPYIYVEKMKERLSKLHV